MAVFGDPSILPMFEKASLQHGGPFFKQKRGVVSPYPSRPNACSPKENLLHRELHTK
ncbi:hypothetical protein DPMN_086792 [Dreissena polymorpha]|uniref:Uncharacterized protein n=1 Tax=Dreissena polymorpha TaxID=45954 RepID=A0A9D4KRU6_DREPO|nr:hypothetical protein DPMN_086792 [Dreissena polymorpha]